MRHGLWFLVPTAGSETGGGVPADPMADGDTAFERFREMRYTLLDATTRLPMRNRRQQKPCVVSRSRSGCPEGVGSLDS